MAYKIENHDIRPELLGLVNCLSSIPGFATDLPPAPVLDQRTRPDGHVMIVCDERTNTGAQVTSGYAKAQLNRCRLKTPYPIRPTFA